MCEPYPGQMGQAPGAALLHCCNTTPQLLPCPHLP